MFPPTVGHVPKNIHESIKSREVSHPLLPTLNIDRAIVFIIIERYVDLLDSLLSRLESVRHRC